MAKAKWGQKVHYEPTHKGTSLGRRPIFSTMNKNRRKNWKKYKGQGR